MKKYKSIFLLFPLMFMVYSPALWSEIVLKPNVGFGSSDQSSVTPQFFYGGQAGFSTDINVGTEGLVNISGSLDGTWWQTIASPQFTANGGVYISLAQGLWVYRAEFSGAFGEDQPANTNPTGNAQFRLIGIRNSTTVSLQIDGSVLFSFSQTPSTKYSGGLSASLLWGEMVVKPGIAVYTQIQSYTLASYAVSPKLGLSWYPAFPIALDISLLYERNLLESGDVFQLNTDFSMQPVPAFGFSLSHEALLSSAEYTGAVWSELRFSLYASQCCSAWWYVSGGLDYTAPVDTLAGWKLSTGIGLRL